MMEVVKITFHDDGEKAHSPKWHLVQNFGDAQRALCTGECFGEGEGGAVYEVKELVKGGVTCENCKRIIRWYKSVPL